jgi:hypothetical protein
MATVYLALDLKHDRRVALKVLHPALSASLGPERFLREIRTTAQLDHPNILSIHDSGDNDGLLWYTMPLVEGESLRQRLRREVQLPIDEALGIARQVADALDYAHQHGIVHRDIKPENILLSEDRARVADFGVAKALEQGNDERLTETGLALGTPMYMSPEQASGGSVDGRSDQYSLACVLYETLAGEPPFGGPTPQAVIAKRFLGPPVAISALRHGVPAVLDLALSRALAPVPADRFATGGEFVRAVTGAAAGKLAPRRDRRRLILLAAALGIIGVIAALTRFKSEPAVLPSASVIAVLPLSPVAADTALERLGIDLAGTVSANLDGVASLRTVDRLTLLPRLLERRSPISLRAGAALARRYGAKSVVAGTLVRSGDLVRADLGLYLTDSLTPLARISVHAPEADVNALTDSITWKVLDEIWRAGPPPTPSLSAVTTRSVPALRAFLEGERALVEGRWAGASDAFSRAIATDSTFWLAYYRYALTQRWQESDPDSSVIVAYERHRNELPVRERLLIEASDGSLPLTERLARSRSLAERFPSYWPAWFQLADDLFHLYPYIGTTRDDARVALQKTVELNPGLIWMWDHLGIADLLEHDTAGAMAVFDTLSSMNAWPRIEAQAGGPLAGVDPRLSWRVILSLERGRGAPRPLLDSLAQAVARAPVDATSNALLDMGYAGEQIRLSDLVIARNPNSAATLERRRGNAWAWAARGNWRRALSIMDSLTAMTEGGPLEGYELAMLGVWFGGLAPADAERRRESMKIALGQLGTKEQAATLWLDGMLALVQRDRRGLATARAALTRLGTPATRILDESLATFELEFSGERQRAGKRLADLEWRLVGQPERRALPAAFLPITRVSAARSLVQAGDTAQAVKLLRWHTAAAWDGVGMAVHGLVHLEQARIDEERGATDDARRHYQQFLLRYDMPSPSQRHLVEEAKLALARLEHRAPAPGKERGGE